MTAEITLAGIGVLGSIVAAVLLLLGTRGKTRAEAKTALDARIDARLGGELDRVYKRIDEVEADGVRRTSAFARILRAIAAQWPAPHGPNLDPRDIAEIEDTIPPQWLRHPSTKE